MLARLPIPAGPARHEIVPSYLTRLTLLHGLPEGELFEHLSTNTPADQPARKRGRVVADRLAVVTGRPVEHLALALPELRDPALDWTAWRHQSQPGCPRCDARHIGGPVLRLLPHHYYVCTRHRYWIGPPDAGQPPTPLHDLVGDQIVAAQHRHNRLLARHGAAAAFDAVLTGFLLCGHLWNHGQREQTAAVHEWERRAEWLIPPGTVTTAYSTSLLFAAVYPEAVSFAALIASPTWRHLAHGDTDEQRVFLSESCRRVGRVVPDPGSERADAIRHWMIFDSHRPPSRPDKTFPETREYAASRPAKPNNASLARTQRGARWFAANRYGGSSILHHRHIRPVLAREWATKMDGITATISASSSLFDYGGIRARDYERQHNENAKENWPDPS
ncbi:MULTISPECIES: TniQ family protein [Mycobacterium]|uniref:TniQ family protein n=1 Tax=Mycobacterium TaxID=1763 RepID=UPI00069BB970|nr:MULTISPECIES: TniQ family protein [Mycobacterium]PJE03281.1 MAG: hypothetical protein CK429_33190 [Mycobacterium sp.]MDP7707488.1 TniQ family protein [Mycobacterium sp. TY815]OBJ81299.1 hypothetical protein A9W97_26065 [Mycobacterium gordonae]VBA34508.1 hypothetical protein LAUMK35_05752 [Mycobacterium pseudokansasii]VBA35953.1 hypothetical protein LAUMK21_05735 [Mycobacterium pseudokansasii]